MNTYTFGFNNQQLGTIVFDGDKVEFDFDDPDWQGHFMDQADMLKPTNIEELIRSGYSYYDIAEVKEQV